MVVVYVVAGVVDRCVVYDVVDILVVGVATAVVRYACVAVVVADGGGCVDAVGWSCYRC